MLHGTYTDDEFIVHGGKYSSPMGHMGMAFDFACGGSKDRRCFQCWNGNFETYTRYTGFSKRDLHKIPEKGSMYGLQ